MTDATALADRLSQPIGPYPIDEFERDAIVRALRATAQPTDAAQALRTEAKFYDDISAACYTGHHVANILETIAARLFTLPVAGTTAQPCDGRLREAVGKVRHALNDWADIASNSIDWLRNIKNGISTADEALANAEKCYARVIELSRDAEKAILAAAPVTETTQEPDADLIIEGDMDGPFNTHVSTSMDDLCKACGSRLGDHMIGGPGPYHPKPVSAPVAAPTRKPWSEIDKATLEAAAPSDGANSSETK